MGWEVCTRCGGLCLKYDYFGLLPDDAFVCECGEEVGMSVGDSDFAHSTPRIRQEGFGSGGAIAALLAVVDRDVPHLESEAHEGEL